MRGDSVNSSYTPHNKADSLKLILDMVPSSFSDNANTHARSVDVFVEDEHACVRPFGLST